MVIDQSPAVSWERRHRVEDELRSGGDLSFDSATNAQWYAGRLGVLLELIGDSAGLFLLDAGCGKGYFSDALSGCGHHVDGIDASRSAIDFCLQHRSGRYWVSTLASWRSPWLYDVVYAIDVLFHIADEREWAESLDNIATLVRANGLLVVTEREGGGQGPGGQRGHRSSAEHERRLVEHGMALTGVRPFRFREVQVSFLTFRKIH